MPVKDRRAVLARYTDPQGRPHRVVLLRHLLMDLSSGRLTRVVAVLGAGEGKQQARALLDGSALDEGYLARARRETGPFIRALCAEDLRPPAHQRDATEADSGHGAGAECPPLAA